MDDRGKLADNASRPKRSRKQPRTPVRGKYNQNQVDDHEQLLGESTLGVSSPRRLRASRLCQLFLVAAIACMIATSVTLFLHPKGSEWTDQIKKTVFGPTGLDDTAQMTLERIGQSGKVVLYPTGSDCHGDEAHLINNMGTVMTCIFFEKEPLWKDYCWSEFLAKMEKYSLSQVKESVKFNTEQWLHLIPLSRQLDYNGLHRFGSGKSPRWRHSKFPTPCQIYVIGPAEAWEKDVMAWNGKCQINNLACQSKKRSTLNWCPDGSESIVSLAASQSHKLSHLHLEISANNLAALSNLVRFNDTDGLPHQASVSLHLRSLSTSDVLTALQALHHIGYHAFAKQVSLDEKDVLNLYLSRFTAPWVAPQKRSLSSDIDAALARIASGEVQIEVVEIMTGDERMIRPPCSSESSKNLLAAHANLQKCLKKPTAQCWSDFLSIVQNVTTTNALALLPKLDIPRSYSNEIQSRQYDFMTQTMYCDYNHLDRVGGTGDGGKWVCQEYLNTAGKCVIYSLGSNGNFVFEEDMGAAVKRLGNGNPCEFHTFDCTGSWPVPNDADGKPVTILHPWCLGADSVQGDRIFKSFSTITKELGHEEIAYLKMDIEGYEIQVFQEMLTPQNVKRLPKQISFEGHVHNDLVTNSTWHSMALVESYNYRVAVKERNQVHPCCEEWVVIRRNN
jgi:hypothetical protein